MWNPTAMASLGGMIGLFFGLHHFPQYLTELHALFAINTGLLVLCLAQSNSSK